MPINGYGYGGYPAAAGYYSPPMPDQLAQLRGAGYQQPISQPIQQVPVQQPATQPIIQQTVPTTQPANMTGPVYVNGEAGAKGYLVAAGNTVMLIDADPDANTFWLKSADASGMPSIRTFDYTERMNSPRQSLDGPQTAQYREADYVPRADFEALASQIEAIRDEIETLKAKRTATPKRTVREDDE